jgi:hypothetical protein
MEKFRAAIKFVAIVFIAVVVYFRFVLPALAPTENLAGNQVTLAMCRWELATWKMYQTNSPVFDFQKLTDDQKRRVIMYGLNQDFSIQPYFVWNDAAHRKIVILSGRLYDNVPTPALWNWFHRNPAHAVGYSDGSTGLISPEHFDRVKSDGYASLWNLTTNPDFKIFKQ